jgi:hypothetical protein
LKKYHIHIITETVMYNKQRLIYVKGTAPFGEIRDDEVPVGVVIVAYFETKDINDILDFGFGDYRDFARYLLTTRELPIEGKFDLRVSKHSDVLLDFPGCEESVSCEIEKVTMLEQRTVDGTYKLEVKIKCPSVSEEEMGTICSQIKHKVIIALQLQQSQLPFEKPKPPAEKKAAPEKVKVEEKRPAPEPEPEEAPPQQEEEIYYPREKEVDINTDPNAYPFDDGRIEKPPAGRDPLEEYEKRGPDYNHGR